MVKPVIPSLPADEQAAMVARAAAAPGSVQNNLPLQPEGPTPFEAAKARMERNDEPDATSKKALAVWRQDSLVSGLVAQYAGSDMDADPDYTPFEPNEWKELSTGIHEDLLPGLYDARSKAHAMYLKGLLMDKQDDIQRLGDMGSWGTAGRLAANVLMPDQLLAGMVGGRAAQAVKALKFLRTGTGTAAVAGVVTGGASNAAFEKIRQSVNFEDDSASVLEAGLMGAAMTVPFAAAHLATSRRVADTALKERQALDALRKHEAGEALSEHETKVVDEVHRANSIVADLEAGRITPEEAESHFLKGSVGAAQVAPVPSVATERTAMSPLRMDVFATLNRSSNPFVQKLGFGLVKDAIQVDKDLAQGWTASEWKSHFVRTIKGDFFREATEAAAEARKARGLGLVARIRTGFDREFHELTSRLTRGDDSVLAANTDIAPMLKRASAAQRKAYDNMFAEAVHAGVEGADAVTPADFYVNRVWDQRRMREAAAKHGGWDAVYKLVAGAIRVPGKTGDLKKAKSFVDTVRKLEWDSGLQDVLLKARDMGTLRKELDATGKLSPSEIDDFVDVMFEAKPTSADSGQAPNLKFRFDLDENFSLSTGAGDLRIADLIENDSRVLMDRYTNSMGGHTALAKMGIRSRSDWDARMKEASDWHMANVTGEGSKEVRDQKLLQDIYAHLTGRPMSSQDFTTTARFASAMRGYTRSVMLGQLGVSAAFEMKQAAALFGIRALTQHSPSFGQFLKAVRAGHVPDEALSRDIQAITGFGNEMAMSYARHAELEDGFSGRALSRFEDVANKASHTVDLLSGNASFTSLTRQLSGRMAAQRFLDMARDGRKLTPKWRERMVGWGIDSDDLDQVFSDFVKHAEFEPNGRLTGIRWEDFSSQAHASYEKFQLAMSRAGRDAIQDQDLGETIPFMHSTLGKLFGELKTFFLVAHAKNMLKNVHYRDQTAFQIWTIGLLGESLGYMTQTAANYAHDPDELARRLDPERVALAATMRMSSAGFMPFLLETGYGVATGESLVQAGSGITANTDNRNLFQPPSVIVAKRIWQSPQQLVNLLSGSDVVTQSEMRDTLTALPGARLWGIANAINYLVALQPKTDPEKPGR